MKYAQFYYKFLSFLSYVITSLTERTFKILHVDRFMRIREFHSGYKIFVILSSMGSTVVGTDRPSRGLHPILFKGLY